MEERQHHQYRIIILLSLVILAYCIFAYPYVFNNVDAIKYRMWIAELSPQMEIVKGWVSRTDSIFKHAFSRSKMWIADAVEWLNVWRSFFKNVYHDFII
jgi:hypothetical protein